jgi:riboflavin kinase/FMN adenylyltransferase
MKRELIWGKVKPGSKRGKLLGFPTLNLKLHKNISEGVYLAKVKIEGRLFSSLTFVGAAKTFGQKQKKVESYILDFDKDIYGKWITVELSQKIRGNIKFNSEKELIRQIKKDLKFAMETFGK